MAVATPSKDFSIPLTQAFSVIGTTILTAVTVHHAYNIFKFKAKDPVRNYTAAYASLALIAVAYELLIICLLESFAPSESLCAVEQGLAIPPYCIFKLILYMICTHRLHLVFGDATYAPKHLKCWAITIAVWSVLNVVLSAILTETHYIAEDNVCDMEDPTYMSLTSIALLDLSATILYSIFFIKPVMRMHQLARDDNFDQRLLNVAKKQMILGLSVIFSSLLVMFGIALIEMDEMWIAIDVTVSVLSVVLMFKWNASIAFKACFCCLKELQEVGDTTAVNMQPAGSQSVPKSNSGQTRTMDVSNEEKVEETVITAEPNRIEEAVVTTTEM
eukprot:118328_1